MRDETTPEDHSSVRAHSLIGVPLVGWLDATDWSTRSLILWVALVGIVGQLLLMMGAIAADPLAAADLMEWVVMGLSAGTGTVFHLCCMLYLGRNAQTLIESDLGFDRTITKHRSAAEHRGPVMLICFAAAMTVAVLISVEFAIPGSYLEGPPTPVGKLILYGIVPLNLFVASVTLIVYMYILRYFISVAREVELSILRLDQYSCLALPLLVLIALISMIVSILGGGLFFVAEEESVTGFLVMIACGLLAFVVLSIAALRPVLIMRNRLQSLLHTEREFVVNAINGERQGLAQSQLVGESSSLTHGDLLAQLIYIEGLSPWPIGSHIRGFILFGLLPPITWAMAATVENLLY